MSAIFSETLRFGQPDGTTIQLLVTGDEDYARYETLDGYTAVYDEAQQRHCYAVRVNGVLISSTVPVTAPPPPGLRRHLRESTTVRARRADARRAEIGFSSAPALTFGPEQGLLDGRRLSTGNVRGLTILVEFQDVRTNITKADVEDLLNGQNYTRNGNFCSAREYFRIVSSGKLNYTNDVVGPFLLSRNRSYYVQNLLVKEALDLAVASGVDLRRYDSRGEGIVDALNILYAGETQYLKNLWPHNSYIDLRYGNLSTNLYLLTSLGNNANSMTIGTFCHENGHLLCRFPDMYDYGARGGEGDGGDSAGIGCYCLMGSGNHLNGGRTPSPVSAYLRDLAGWCDNQIVLSAPGVFEAQHGDYRTVMKYKSARPNEYFIVENRAKLGLDTHLPSSGLAVYHCDTLGSNEFQDGTAQEHYQCALLQADGRRDLESNVNAGDGADLFSAVTGVAVSDTTNPSSRLWDGSDSGFTISDVEVPDTRIGFRFGAAVVAGGTRGENNTAIIIPDNNQAGITSTIHIAQGGAVKQARVTVDITHSYIGDLIVELTGPGGQKAVLHNRAGKDKDNLLTTYEPDTTAALAVFAGSDALGNWVLAIRDEEGADVGKLNRWSLDLVTDAAPKAARGEASPNLAIPDNNQVGVSSVIGIAATGTVRQVKVSVNITHTYIGDLRLELISPAGRSVVLHAQLGGSQDNLIVTYDSATPLSPLSGIVGQSLQGNWTLRVADLAPVDVGTLDKWSLELVPTN